MDKIHIYIGGSKIVQLLLLAIVNLCWFLPSVYSEEGKSIVLGTIESHWSVNRFPSILGEQAPHWSMAKHLHCTEDYDCLIQNLVFFRPTFLPSGPVALN